MSAPLYPLGAFGEGAGFLLIFLLGFGFGFFLERAGFASARKLTGMFYFRDFAVLRVMFTAIVVAMLGLLYLASLGVVDMAAMSIPPTILGAQIVGGLLLGVGFIVGGYCPGTSVVGVASGKIDAIFYVLGVIAGSGLFGLGYEPLQGLYHWGEQGVVTLSQWSGLSGGALAPIIVMIALAAFAATEIVDRRRRGESLEEGIQVRLTWPRAGAVLASVAALALLVGHTMAGTLARNVQPAAAEQPAAVTAKPAAAPAVAPAGARPLPGGLKKFKKGSSCS
ncbi:MAG: YeeE/YedE family protein [Acidobacteria bacterium]|nr:YeeE/YedE family protein [Acidobacteriota bacterium]